MAMKIILVDDDTKQAETVIDVEIHDQSWEEDCYRTACHVARALAEWYLKNKDNEILQKRPTSHRVKDTHERTLVTRFGDITFSRRYYRDEHGKYQ